MMGATRNTQSGITVLGFLILASLFGVVGLGVLKVTPMYIKSMRMSTIMGDIEKEMSGQSPTPQSIRYALQRRFSVEDIRMGDESLKITPSKTGFSLRIAYEDRAPYVADVYLVLAFDKQVEITR